MPPLMWGLARKRPCHTPVTLAAVKTGMGLLWLEVRVTEQTILRMPLKSLICAQTRFRLPLMEIYTPDYNFTFKTMSTFTTIVMAGQWNSSKVNTGFKLVNTIVTTSEVRRYFGLASVHEHFVHHTQGDSIQEKLKRIRKLT